jgi:predicted secreted protein
MASNKKIYIFGLVSVAVIIATTAIGVGSLLSDKAIKQTGTMIFLTMADNGNTISVKKGDQVHLELKDYGDGGYAWNIKTIDDKIFSLSQRLDSESSGMIGDFGNDIWIFTAEETGTMTLGLECQRSWDTSDICASFSIVINIV